MKKLIMMAVIALGVASVSSNAYAQKPVKGEFATEILLNPWNDGGETFSLLDGVKGRYFISDKLAVRATIGFNMGTSTEFTEYVGADGKDHQYELVNKATSFGIAPGIEYHLGNWEKVSLYVGGEISFSMNSASGEITNDENGNTIELSGGTIDFDPLAVNPVRLNAAPGSSFGVGAFTGIDYYVASNLYLGAEFGLYYNSNSNSDMTLKVTGVDDVEYKNDNKSSSLGFACQPSVRVGWKF